MSGSRGTGLCKLKPPSVVDVGSMVWKERRVSADMYVYIVLKRRTSNRRQGTGYEQLRLHHSYLSDSYRTSLDHDKKQMWKCRVSIPSL